MDSLSRPVNWDAIAKKAWQAHWDAIPEDEEFRDFASMFPLPTWETVEEGERIGWIAAVKQVAVEFNIRWEEDNRPVWQETPGE